MELDVVGVVLAAVGDAVAQDVPAVGVGREEQRGAGATSAGEGS